MKKFLFSLTFAFVFVTLALCGSFGFTYKKAEAFKSSNVSSAVTIGELWNSSSKTFNTSTLTTLLQFVTGDTNITPNSDFATLKSLSQSKKTATDFRNVAVTSTSDGSVKASGKDIIVSLGGLNWTPTYLSLDTNNNPILTLWLSDAFQLSGKTFYRPASGSPTATPIAHTFGSYGTTIWNAGEFTNDAYDSSLLVDYPDAMYGTSCIRSVILNNGGMYTTSLNGASTATFTQKTNSVFSPFTVTTSNKSAIADYLVSPKYVSWQMVGQNLSTSKFYDIGGNWKRYQPDSYYEKNFNWSNRDKFDAWKDDLLWLPSASEAGGSTELTCLWKTSVAQRSIGVTGGSWTRSSTQSAFGDYGGNGLYSIHYSGDGFNTGGMAGTTDSVRPCVHLNLNAACGKSNTNSIIEVGELWDNINREFDADNVTQLLQLVTGDSSASIKNLSSVKSQATATKTSKQINEVVYGGKKAGTDIVVTLGGVKWLPVYLSNDSSGNPILTLWLYKSNTLLDKKYYVSNSEYSYFDGAMHSTWNSGFSAKDTSKTGTYPDNMYGTSYIRSVILNNGGLYSTATGGTSTATFTKKTDSVFSPFTVAQNNKQTIADYLVTPANVPWQTGVQDQLKGSVGYLSSNESWQTNQADTGYSSSEYNYSTKTNYDAWKNDLLWLPSLSEVGSNLTYPGIWATTITQRNNANYTWYRSAYAQDAYRVYLTPQVNYGYSYVSAVGRYSVRPAIHLSLSSISPANVKIDELWDYTNKQFNNENVTKLLQYVTGDSATSVKNLNTVKSQANNTKTSTQINAVALGDKKAGDDIVVTLGGLKWIPVYLSNDVDGSPVLTLWLWRSSILSGLKYYKSSSLYSTFNSTATSAWNSGFTANDASKTGAYPDNMYGTSYIRSVILNNGGLYSTATGGTSTATFNKKTDSVFSPFTVTTSNNSAIADYLVSPNNIPWQRSGQNQIQAGVGYLCANETLELNQSDDGYYSSDLNYSKKTGYDAWKNDLLWLPSLTETGYNVTYQGIWATTVNQRNNVGYSLLRTAYKSDAKQIMINPRSGYGYNLHDVQYNYCVRPAIHLSLSNLSSSTSTDVGSSCSVDDIEPQMWNPAGNVIPELAIRDSVNNRILTRGVDYNVVASSYHAKPGEQVTLTITGIGDYSGTITKSYTVTKRQISLALKGNSLSIPNQSYTGQEIKPILSNLRDYGYLTQSSTTPQYSSGLVLGENIHYSLTYLNNTERGTATIVITGIGDYYEGSTTTSFTITQASLTNATLTLAQNSVTYEYGEDFLPSLKTGVSLKYNDEELTTDDYTISYLKKDGESVVTKITEVGVYLVRVVGKGNYTGTKDAEFEVICREITRSDIKVNLGSYDFTYNGSSHEVNAQVVGSYTKDGSIKQHELVRDTEYTISYDANINASNAARLIIEGIGNFTGTRTLNFTIKPKSLNSADIVLKQAIEDVTYNGNPYTPTIEVYDNSLSADLVLGVDYTIAYKNNTNASIGSSQASVVINGINNYTNHKEFYFTISPKDISLATISAIADQTFRGSAIEPNLIVNDNGKTLVKNKDYTVTCKNNINVTTSGGASVVIDGVGNYTGKNTAVFTIIPADLSTAIITMTPSTTVYSATSATTSLSVRVGSTIIANTNYDVTVLNGAEVLPNGLLDIVNVGTYTIRVEGKANYEGTAQGIFEVTACEISNVTATLNKTSFSYNQETQTPNITLVYNGLTLNEGNDYSYTFRKTSSTGATITNPTTVGTYYIVLQGKGNFKGTDSSLSFEIIPADIKEGSVTFSVDPNEADFTFDGETHKILLRSLIVNSKEYFRDVVTNYISVTYLRDSEETTNFINAGVITIKVTAIDENVTGERIYSYEIKRKSLSMADTANQLRTSELENKIYNRNIQQQKLTIVDTSVNNYELTSDDFTISYSPDCTNVGKVTIYLTATTTGNYKDSITREYQILPATVNSFALVKESGKYNTKAQVILATVKVVDENAIEEDIILTPSEYSFSYSRNDEPTTNITSVGRVLVGLNIRSKNFVLDESVMPIYYTIEKVQIKAINLKENLVTYDGGSYSITVASVTTDEGTVLVENEDYTISYYNADRTEIINKDNLIVAGNYYVKVDGKNNAEGTKETTFTILRKELTNNGITYYETYSNLEFKKDSNNNRIEIELETNYRGQYVMPVVSVKLRGNSEATELVYADSLLSTTGDFTFGIYDVTDTTFSNNLLGGDKYLFVGEYNFVVTGINNYTGSVSKVYKVNLADFNNDNISVTFNVQKIFSGSPVTYQFAQNKGEEAEVKVTYVQGDNKPEELILNIDFILFNGYIKVTLNDKNEITSAEISNKTVYDESNDGVISEGVIVLKVDNGYVNNSSVGKGTLVLQGKENSTFTTNSIVTKQFDISKVSFSADNLTFTGFNDEYVYQGKDVISPEDIEVTINYKASLTQTVTQKLVYGTDYELTLSDCTNVGEVTAIVKGINSYKDTISVKLFNIVPKVLTRDMFIISPNVTYSKGQIQQPTIIGSYNSNEMVENFDYTISYKRDGQSTIDFVSAGIIVVELSGMGNFTDAEEKLNINFTINKQIINEIVLTNNITSFTGFDQTPTDILVKDVLGNVVDDIEYTLVYSRKDDISNTKTFVNAGTITIGVETPTTSNYTLNGNTVFVTFTIQKANLSTATCVIKDQVYTGSGIDLSNSISLTLTTLDNTYKIDSSEYEILEYRNNINVSTAGNNALIVLKANEINFTGRSEINFNIVPKDISNADVKVNDYNQEFIYNAKEQKPTFNLTYLYNTLVLNTDYSINIVRNSGEDDETGNSINVGGFDVTISGIGNYTGSIELSYSILPRDISSCTTDVSFVEHSFVYTGSEIKPTISSILITFDGTQLNLSSSNYTLTFANNTNATIGTPNKAYITINATGNFTGNTVKEFDILQKSLETDMLIEVKNKSYIGNTVTLLHTDFIFSYGSYEFKETDYQISYLQNPVNVGTYLISVTGKDNFKGTIETTFNIIPISLKDAQISFNQEKFSVNEITYTGLNLKQTLLDSLIVTIGDVLLNGYDYDVVFENDEPRYLIDIGTKNFTLVENNKNIIDFKNSSFDIIQKTIEDNMLEVPKQELVYTGNEIKPIYYLKYNDVPLVLDTDYSITYYENINACPSSNVASFSIKGIGNFNGTIVYAFSIKQATPELSIKEEQNFFYGDTLTAETLYNEYINRSIDGALSFKDVRLSLGENPIRYSFIPTDARNYRSVNGNFSIYAVYNIKIEFDDVSNVIAGEGTNINVSVKIKNGDEYLLLNNTNYSVSTILLDTNQVVNNFKLAGNYRIKVTLNYLEGDYYIDGEDFVEFYAKSKYIYAEDAPFYAVNENYFEEGIKLIVEKYTSRDEIISLVGADNYENNQNISKGYKVIGFYKNGVKLEGEELAKLSNVKIYFNPTAHNEFFVLNNDNSLSSAQLSDGKMLVKIDTCLVETTVDSTKIIIYISIALGLVLLILVTILIIKLIGRQKAKQIANPVNISMSELNKIANAPKQNNINMGSNANPIPPNQQPPFINVQNGPPMPSSKDLPDAIKQGYKVPKQNINQGENQNPPPNNNN